MDTILTTTQSAGAPVDSKGNILRTTIEGQPDGMGRISLLTFDRPDSSVNILDRATLEELQSILADIEADPTICGLILISAKERTFIAGADLESLQKGRSDTDGLRQYLALGQSVINQLSGMTVPTVAAIHGACIGGGYETALACNYRIATPAAETRIGLPETRLGILPAWGGSTRLPRLIGVPLALDIVLGGKTPCSRNALDYGMIDEIAPREWLLRAAVNAILQRRVPKSRLGILRNPVVDGAIGLLAGLKTWRELMRHTRGHYPALHKALPIIVRSVLRFDPYPSLGRERAAVLELARSQESGNLMRVYLMHEHARKRKSTVEPERAVTPGPEVECVAVIGAGLMGAAIAQWLSAHGLRVILRDVNTARVSAGMTQIFKLYDDAVKRHVLTPREARDGMDRISPAPAEVPIGLVQLVIEAAVEKLQVKEQIFQRLDSLAPSDAILATNTSALSISKLAERTGRPGRVVGIHFFNPVHRMQLVEVAIPENAAPDVTARVMGFVRQIGKLAVVVRDTPGFLVNRILLPYLMEAAQAFDSGVSARAIDESMLDFGMPMGPLRLVDEVGVDIAIEVATTLAAAFPDRMTVPPLLTKMLKAGMLGRKSNHGFYSYGRRRAAKPSANWQARELRSADPSLARLSKDKLQARMVYRMLDEAVRCLDDHVVATPEDVDFGLIMGAGFPAFRGGPLRYADALGATRIVKEMEALRLKPCERLCQMAAEGRRFYGDEYRW